MLQSFWQKEDKIVVAVSGGIDSMVLAHLLLKQCEKDNLIFVHVNHFMRVESTNDQQFVVHWANKNNVIIETNDSAPVITNEEKARKFRYQLLYNTAKKYDAKYIVTAHHQDDQVETVLMALIRTGSMQSVEGMPYSQQWQGNIQLIRPLLHVTKQQLMQYAVQNNIHYVHDKTNDSHYYTRNRIRHNVVPQLKKENNQMAQHIAQFANELHDVNVFISRYIDERYSLYVQKKALLWHRLLSEQAIIQKKIIAKWLFDNNSLSRSNVMILWQSMQKQNGQKQFDLGNGKVGIKNYKTVTIESKSTIERLSNDIGKNDDKTIIEPYGMQYINFNETQTIQTVNALWHIIVTNQNILYNNDVINNGTSVNNQIIIPVTSDDLPLCVRYQNAGDIIKIKHGHKKLSRVFIDNKVVKNERQYIPLLVTKNNQIIMILKNGLEYLSKYQETGKIKSNMTQHYVIVEREKINDSQ